MSIEISAKEVKELRNRTGAGMMNCKKALQASSGDMNIAIDYLRKKGLVSASKKSGRVTTEGIIESYIHAGSKIGVLVELNCETDFVARREEFQVLARHISMQIAACPEVEYVSINDISEETISNETKIESEKEDLVNKPKEVRDKIVKGRINKRLQEISLMSQAFIRDQSISVEDLINQYISLLGENIKIRRFQKFILGEGLDKKSINFANEVAEIIAQ